MTIYQLMIGKKQINDVYYSKDDAANNATQIAMDTRGTVAVWEAEEIEGIPYDELDWSPNRMVVWV